MAKNRGVLARDEIDVSRIRRDSRPPYVRFVAWTQEPENGIIVLAITAGVCFFVPALVKLGFAIAAIYALVMFNTKQGMLVRVPEMAGVSDPTEKIPNSRKVDKGKGIMYLGHDRSPEGSKEQVWLSNSDARTHFFTLGTTGSGKTQALLSWAFNSLSWGSGFVYIDGKADNELIYQAYAMCRRLGREDDFFVVNFMTGDSDAFEIHRSNDRGSNTINPMSTGSSNSLTQLVSSLMPESGGDNAMWQGLAIGMVNAVIIGLCYKRYRDGFTIDAGILRDYIELSALIALTKEFERREDVPKDLVFKPLKTYLMNLPGFDWETNLMRTQPVSEDTKKQHDFRSMQFLRQLTMLADTYGSVFKAQIPEVDMLDIVLKRRIVIVCIPSLEKSEEESQGVGKLVVSAIRLMMSKTLGSKVEGDYDAVVKSKPTNSPSPFIAIFDELGYYFTKGMAIMFAQARGLGFALFAAGQDLSAMMKGANKEEAESVVANAKFKITLAMEDPERTADLIIKTGGEAMISEVAGYEGKMGAVASATYRDNLNATIQMRKRVTLEELRDMDSGESIMMWRDRIVRMQNFYVFDGPGKIGRMKTQHLNRLLCCFPPSIHELTGYVAPKKVVQVAASDNILNLLLSDANPIFTSESDEIGDELLIAPSHSVDVGRNREGVQVELGLFYKFSEWYDGQDKGTTSNSKSKTRGISLTPGGHEESPLGAPKPVIGSNSLVINFDALFTKNNEVVYPFKPRIDESKLDLAYEEVDGIPTINEVAWKLTIDNEVEESLRVMDKILAAESSSSGAVKRIMKYRSNPSGLSRNPEDPNLAVQGSSGFAS